MIQPCSMEHIKQYGEIFTKAFSGEPWNIWLTQARGIAKKLLTNCIEEMKRWKIVDIHLITQHDGFLPEFYERYGFKRESEVMLMGMELS